jgi:hypothetical protein
VHLCDTAILHGPDALHKHQQIAQTAYVETGFWQKHRLNAIRLGNHFSELARAYKFTFFSLTVKFFFFSKDQVNYAQRQTDLIQTSAKQLSSYGFVDPAKQTD